MHQPPDSTAVIVVEDDASMARLMIHCLSKAGFAVEHFPDGRAALKLLERTQLPALIIVDYLMPYADGLRVTRTLRDHDHWQTVPIICVTGTTHEDTMIQGLRIHSGGFLTKPFKPEELIALVRRLIAKSSRATGPSPTDVDD